MTSKDRKLEVQKDSFKIRNQKSGNYLLKKTIKKYVMFVLQAFLLFGLCFLILQPIFNKISVSFMEEQDLYDSTVIVLAKNFTMDNYKLAARLMNFWKTLGNTFLISTAVSIVQIISCTLVGYGFARFKFPLKKFWFAMVVLVIIVPPQTISTSLFLHFRYFDIFGIFEAITGSSLNLRGSVLPYFMMCLGCMGLKDGLYIYMIRQFFSSIPQELEEAAYVDGCSTLTTFIKIMLPNAVPILTSCFLFSFVWQWTDNFYSRMFLGNTQLLAQSLTSISERLGHYIEFTLGKTGGATPAYTQSLISTGLLMSVIPLIILYLFAQRNFIESISSSGIKM